MNKIKKPMPSVKSTDKEKMICPGCGECTKRFSNSEEYLKKRKCKCHYKSTDSQKEIFRHKRIKNAVMQYHDAFRRLSEGELKRVPNKYWIDDLPTPPSITRDKITYEQGLAIVRRLEAEETNDWEKQFRERFGNGKIGWMGSGGSGLGLGLAEIEIKAFISEALLSQRREIIEEVKEKIEKARPIFFTHEGKKTLDRDIKIRNQLRKEILDDLLLTLSEEIKERV
jgi:hypothetical protein